MAQEIYLPGFAFGLNAQRQAVRLAADEMRNAIKEAKHKGYTFGYNKPDVIIVADAKGEPDERPDDNKIL